MHLAWIKYCFGILVEGSTHIRQWLSGLWSSSHFLSLLPCLPRGFLTRHSFNSSLLFPVRLLCFLPFHTAIQSQSQKTLQLHPALFRSFFFSSADGRVLFSMNCHLTTVCILPSDASASSLSENREFNMNCCNYCTDRLSKREEEK